MSMSGNHHFSLKEAVEEIKINLGVNFDISDLFNYAVKAEIIFAIKRTNYRVDYEEHIRPYQFVDPDTLDDLYPLKNARL